MCAKYSAHRIYPCLVAALWWISSVASAQPTLKTVATFGSGALSNVANPFGGVLVSSNGFLYGTTLGYPEHPPLRGLFRMRHDGSDFAILHEFGSTLDDGLPPCEGLIQAKNGRIYGATRQGGTANQGVLFSLNPDGSDYRILHRFAGVTANDGGDPRGGLTEGSDGLLYGATALGGIADGGPLLPSGTVFRIAPDETGYQILYSFFPRQPAGVSPTGVIQGTDGLLYGACDRLGSGFGGSLWRIGRDGSGFEVLHAFSYSGTNGNFPNARLLQANDGRLYGTTVQNDQFQSKSGVIYRLHTDGSGFEVLRRPTPEEGEYLWWELVQAGDGKLYGMAERGGAKGLGSLFRLNLDGSGFEVVHSFTATLGEGALPGGKLALGFDGTLFGVTVFGGNEPGGFGDGTVFTLDLSPPLKIGLRLLPAAAWQLDGVGAAGQKYRVQSLGSLSGNWTTLAEPVADAQGRFSVSGTAPGEGTLFLRAIPF